VTRSTRMLIAAAAVAAAGAAYWLLLLAPKRAEATRLDGQVAAKQAEVSQYETTAAGYDKARGRYKTNYATLVSLGKALPSDDDVRSLLVQVSAASGHSGVDFHSIEVASGSGAGANGPTVANTSAATPPPGAVNDSGGTFFTMPFTFTFGGTFADLDNFLARVQRFVTVNKGKVEVSGRLLRIQSIQLTPAADGYPQIQASITANTFLLPETKTPAAGATAPSNTSTTSGTSAADAPGGIR
jgi:hypothetical protein